MKILLICANGLSTSILMNKMQKWGKEKNIELEVRAFPMSEYFSLRISIISLIKSIANMQVIK